MRGRLVDVQASDAVLDDKPETATAAPTAKQARQGSKKAAILELIGRKDGATVKELMSATDWLPHSVRGFVSNLVRKQKIEAIKRESGERAYHLAAGK